MKLSELAELTGARVEGAHDDIEIVGAAGLDEATEGHVTFLANPRYTPRVNTTRASAIYLSEEAQTERQIAILRVKDPYLAYTRALRIFYPEPEIKPFIHPSAVIDPSATIAEGVAIGACAVIGRNVCDRRRCLYPSKRDGLRRRQYRKRLSDSLRRRTSRTHSHRRTRDHSQQFSVIGCDGFGYAKDEQKRWLKIPQAGRVVIEDDVEIGAATTIDRASVGESRIGRGSKLDNLVQIGHSCTVAEDSLLCAQVGLAGSSHIGSRVILAGQAGVAGHLKIGDDVVLTAKSATSHDIPAGKVISGIPAFDNKDWLRSTAAFRRLGEMQRTLRELQRRLKSADSADETKQSA